MHNASSYEPDYRPQFNDLLTQALLQHLLAQYGSTMGITDVASEIHVTETALRVWQARFGRLPLPLPNFRFHRWPTREIAVWLCSLGGDQGQRLLNETAGAKTPPGLARRGRRRKIKPSGAQANRALRADTEGRHG